LIDSNVIAALFCQQTKKGLCMLILRSSGLRAFFAIAAIAISVDAVAVDADAAQALAKKNNCFRCHGVDKDKDGPAWKKISAKYKGQAGAEEKLIHHLTTGEKAKFPDGHEEDHAILKSDDASQTKNLVDWILSL
jgi:cytochrome c